MTSILNDLRTLADYSAFEAFARALWAEEAAVMVGAGFSRVCVRESDAPMPPLWGDFATQMESALGYGVGKGPDALRLAQEYQAQHGDDGLDRLIRQLVTDDRWEPSRLHKQLMDFPWRDVLTTNWDTLVERTAPETPDRIYGCVRTVQDIAHERRPRIVKLHGSLPSHKPFIFTEDDFRTYPSRFTAFVNLAQQVMLENELCLLGFSGSDPNFLAWSGWVRDTLAQSARRIRLVGVLNLTPAARSLLEARNVTPIDLAPLVSHLHPSQRHEKALELFFGALIEAKPPSPFEWHMSLNQLDASPGAAEAERPTLREVAAIWAKDRAAYPGWIIAPKSAAQKLAYRSLTIRAKQEESPDHLKFAVECVWRHRTAGTWIYTQLLQDADQHYDAAASFILPVDLVHLCVAAASQWRLFQQWDLWSKWMGRLEAISTTDARLWHAYESGLKAQLDWDDEAILAAAEALRDDAPIWMMRRAGLLSTLFRYREAAQLYEAALRSIRIKLRAAPKSPWLISLEGWAVLFHHVTYNALNDDLASLSGEERDETRLRHVAAKADPWDHISHLDKLAAERIARNQKDTEEWTLSFQPGRFSPAGVRRLGGDHECPFYGLLDLMERTGAPERSKYFNLFSTRLETAYLALNNPDEADLMTFLGRFRGADRKVLDKILPRMRVALLSETAISLLLKAAVNRANRLLSHREGRYQDDHLRFLLALLSRVVIRADSKVALDTFVWGKDLLASPSLPWVCYKDCDELLKSAMEAMRAPERQVALELALDLKLPVEAHAKAIERDWPELIESFSAEDVHHFEVSARTSSRIDGLIDLVRDSQALDRGRALRRLHTLYKGNKLTDAQKRTLSAAIWASCEEDGWPRDSQLYPWIYMDLPGCQRAVAIFKRTIVERVSNGEISASLLLNLRSGLSLLEVPVGFESITACIKHCLDWRPKPVDNEGMSSFFSNEASLEIATAKEVGYALAHSLLPAVDAENVTAELEAALRELPSMQHIPTISATAFQLARLCPDYDQSALAMVRAAIASRDPNRVYPSFVAINQFAKQVSADTPMPSELVELLVHIVEQRLQPGLGSALKFAGDLIDANCLPEEGRSRIARAIPDIIEEYRYDQDRLSVPSMAELPTVRREVHRLSTIMAAQFPDLQKFVDLLKDDPLPEVRNCVEDWSVSDD